MSKYLNKVEAAYSAKERFQALLKKKMDRHGEKVLLSYDCPEGIWSDFVKSFKNVLTKAGINVIPAKTKSGHISIGLLQTPTPEELEKAKSFGEQKAPTFNIKKVELLKGQKTPFAYITLELDLPQRFKDYFLFLRNLVGNGRIQDYRLFTQDLKPHISILTIDPKYVELARKELPKLTAAWKALGILQLTPKFVEVMHNFEISDWKEISARARFKTVNK